MRIFLAGDHYSGTGPANVTKYYIDNLPEGTLYQKMRHKWARIPEIVINTIRSDGGIYSGYSRQNVRGLKIAKILGRPAAYIMHGCVEYENEINLEPDEEMIRVDRKTIELADLVIAVSKTFCEWLKGYYPGYRDRFDYVFNGMDTSLRKRALQREEKKRHMILSVGGGMPRKKIRYICEAVKKLREEYDSDLYLCVIGDKGADSDKIRSYDFVEDKGIVSFDEAMDLIDDAAVFVQNSCFETFGLAPVEALECGCSILCSKCVGALGLIKDIRPEDIIEKYDDPDEIAAKIRYLMDHPNAQRLTDSIEWESVSWKTRSEALVSKLSELVLKK